MAHRWGRGKKFGHSDGVCGSIFWRNAYRTALNADRPRRLSPRATEAIKSRLFDGHRDDLSDDRRACRGMADASFQTRHCIRAGCDSSRHALLRLSNRVWRLDVLDPRRHAGRHWLLVHLRRRAQRPYHTIFGLCFRGDFRYLANATKRYSQQATPVVANATGFLHHDADCDFFSARQVWTSNHQLIAQLVTALAPSRAALPTYLATLANCSSSRSPRRPSIGRATSIKARSISVQREQQASVMRLSSPSPSTTTSTTSNTQGYCVGKSRTSSPVFMMC